MKRVNLMANPHVSGRDARRNRRLPILLPCAGAVLVALWIAVGSIQYLRGSKAVGEMQRQVVQLRDQAEAVEELEQQHRAEEERRRQYAALREPLPTPAMLALISQVTPSAITLTELTIDVPLTMSSPGASVRDGRDFIAIQIAGHASDARVISQFISRLMDDPLFADVRLTANHRVERDLEVTQAFGVALSIPLSTDRALTAEASR